MSNLRLSVPALHPTDEPSESDDSYARQRLSASNRDRISSIKFLSIATANRILRRSNFASVTSEARTHFKIFEVFKGRKFANNSLGHARDSFFFVSSWNRHPHKDSLLGALVHSTLADNMPRAILQRGSPTQDIGRSFLLPVSSVSSFIPAGAWSNR